MEIIKRSVVLFVTLFLSFAAMAQNTVKGSLADDGNDFPILYCNCVLLKALDSSFAYGTTTDEKGCFTFKQVADGYYLLRISYIGYEPSGADSR